MKIRREAQFGLYFRHWLKANPMPSAAFELKQTTTNSIPFNAVQDHQIDALLAVKSRKGILYKIPDDSRGIKPFDYFCLSSSYAFVVIKFPAGFVIIDCETFLMEKKRSKSKSLSWMRAQDIAIIVVKKK